MASIVYVAGDRPTVYHEHVHWASWRSWLRLRTSAVEQGLRPCKRCYPKGDPLPLVDIDLGRVEP